MKVKNNFNQQQSTTLTQANVPSKNQNIPKNQIKEQQFKSSKGELSISPNAKQSDHNKINNNLASNKKLQQQKVKLKITNQQKPQTQQQKQHSKNSITKTQQPPHWSPNNLSQQNSSYFNQFAPNLKSKYQNKLEMYKIVQSYFQSQNLKWRHKSKIKNYQTAAQQIQNIHENLQQNLNNDNIKISSKTYQIKNLLDKNKLSTEQLRLLEIKAQQEIKSKKIQLLDNFQPVTIDQIFKTQHLKSHKQKTHQKSFSKFYDQCDNKNDNDPQTQQQLIKIISQSVLTKQQHKKLIEKFKTSNKQIQQKRKQRLFQIQQRQRSLSYEKQIAQKQRKKQQKQLRRLSIQQKLSQRKQQHQKFIQQQKNSTQKYKQVKKQTFLHQNIEQRYKSQVLIPILEQKKMKLKQLRDFYKRYDISEIRKHQMEYLDKISKSRSTQKNTSRSKISTFNYNPPQKSKRLAELLQEQNQRAKIKFEEKKKMLQENRVKQLNFLSEIKLKFRPTVDQTKKEEIKQRLKSSQVEKTKHKHSDIDIKQLGTRYFQQSKSRMKRHSEKEKRKTEGNQMQLVIDNNQGKGRNVTVKKYKQKTEGNDKLLCEQEDNQFLPSGEKRKMNTQREEKKVDISLSSKLTHRIRVNESKRKEIKKIINSEQLDRAQKLQRLRLQNEKINQIYKKRERFYVLNEDDPQTRQQAISLLLNSIQTKMCIIDICAEKK